MKILHSVNRDIPIDVYIKGCHENSFNHGFWDGTANQNIPSKLMLIVSEAAEALEDYREGKMELDFDLTIGKGNKPIGFPSEIADIVIRVFDLCGYLGIDLEKAIQAKMVYNQSRPYMHGGKKI